MEINLDAVLTDRSGNALVGADKTPITLGLISVIAIDTALQDSRDSSLKYKMGKVANNLYKGGVQTLKSDEITILKDLIGKVHPPIVVAQAHELLETAHHESAPSNS